MKKYLKITNQLATKFIDQVVKIPIRWYLAGVVLTGAILRFAVVTASDIWHDEGYTMMLIDFSPLEIIARTARDVHPPLYYLLVHGWQHIFGGSDLAIRSFSILTGLAIILLAYFLTRKIFSEGAARLAALLVAFGPFLIRYSVEARMYSLSALLVLASTYSLVLALQSKKANYKLWIAYGLLLAAGLYTQYYTILIVPAHLLYVLWHTGGLKKALQLKPYWLANIVAALLFIPWLPVLIGQFTRVQSGFWIPPVNIHTIPNTLSQLLFNLPAFTNSKWVGWITLLSVIAISIYLYIRLHKLQKKHIILLSAWLFLPLILVLLVSLYRPVYYDRYFLFCAAALHMLTAVAVVYTKFLRTRPPIQILLAAAICIPVAIGIFSIWNSPRSGHRMSEVAQTVNDGFRTGDKIVSAELYTFFDFSHYNQTRQTVHLLSEGELSGHGETSLVYDRQQEIVYHSLADIQAKRVWLVGKVGEKDYFTTQTPNNWQLVSTKEAGDSAVRLYYLK